MIRGRSTRRLTWLVLPAALAAVAIMPASATAGPCEFTIDNSNDGGEFPGALPGGAGSFWSTTEPSATFEDAGLFRRNALGRYDAFDTYGIPEIDGAGYDNPVPSDVGCQRLDGGRTVRYPSLAFGDVVVRPELYVDRQKAFGRQYVQLENTGALPETIDFGWDGGLGSDNLTNLDRTSSGGSTTDAADRWATSCEDTGAAGCRKQRPSSDPELAHNWERKGSKPQSADVVVIGPDGSDIIDITFENVTIGPQKTIALLNIVSLSRSIKPARNAADEIDRHPESYGVFRGLSNTQQNRVKNW